MGPQEGEEKTFRATAFLLTKAVTVFYDPLSASLDDPDHSLDEQRYITIGFSSQGRLLLVAHMQREERTYA